MKTPAKMSDWWKSCRRGRVGASVGAVEEADGVLDGGGAGEVSFIVGFLQ